MARKLINHYRCYLQIIISILIAALLAPTSYALDSALILRGESKSFKEVVNGMIDDLADEIEFLDQVVTNNTTAVELKVLISEHSPTVIVLIGNQAINIYSKYQSDNMDSAHPPSILLAALSIDPLIKKLRNSTGIRYEIPAVTSIVSLRELMGTPLKKVAVIHRLWMSDVVERNRRFCRSEGIDLIGINIANKEKDFAKIIKKKCREY